MALSISRPHIRRSSRSTNLFSGRRRSPIRTFGGILSLLIVAAAVYFIWIAGGSDNDSLAHTWLLDDETRAWMERTCVDLTFAETTVAAVSIHVEDKQSVVQFNDVKQTRLVGTHGRRQLSVRQIIQTSEVGRFCGGQTTLDISWRVAKDRPDELVGRWATPACEVCPVRRFRAMRAERPSH